MHLGGRVSRISFDLIARAVRRPDRHTCNSRLPIAEVYRMSIVQRAMSIIYCFF